MNRWQTILAIVLLVMGSLCLMVYAAIKSTPDPVDDDDSAAAIRSEMDELDEIFGDEDARPNPGVL